jgi:hypothetical protein
LPLSFFVFVPVAPGSSFTDTLVLGDGANLLACFLYFLLLPIFDRFFNVMLEAL